MPPKRRTNNKKKNKNKGKFGHGRDKRTANSSQSAGPAAKATGSLKGKAPAFWENLTSRTRSNLHQAYPTVYARYKKATNRFLDYMKKLCPSEMTQSNGSISANSLLAASDVLVNTGHVMDRSILRDLKLAIRIRTRVQKSVYSGGDAGHKYFIEVLTYCWSVLNSLPKTAKNEKVDSDAESSKQQDTANAFQALMEDSDEEDDIAVEEDMFPSTPVERPSLPSGTQPLSLDELMNSDERNDAVLFLLSLDEIMGCVVNQYQCVYKSLSFEDTTFVEHLLEAAVATNMAIQQVQQLEMDLLLQHEHLTTPYRLLATIVLPEITQHVTATVREHAGKEGCVESNVSVFLGDCMETYFRNPSDPYNRGEEVVNEFCTEWEVNPVGTTELHQLYKGLHQLVVMEVPVASEKNHPDHARIQRLAGGAIPGSHSWIKNMQNIGGDRAIHHTLRLIQVFGQIIDQTPENKGIEAVRGFFGRNPWRAKQVPGTRIRDLDELFMTDILPKWVIMCRKGILSLDQKLPFENELCPLFVLIRQYVQEPQRPVTWSTTFAMHAILTAILEVEPKVSQLMNMSKSVFDNYFKQLEWAKTLAKNNPESLGNPTSPEQHSWWGNMIVVTFLENLGLDGFGLRTLWNPLCAGTIFSYLSYYGNLEAGCSMIDCQAQLRITLHLFHALLTTGILRRGEIQFLDLLYDNFRNSKAIWEGRTLPKRGEFAQRFWVCFGNNVSDARKLSNDSKRIIQETQQTPNSKNRQNHGSNTRKLVAIESSDISKSYRRICNRDFHDVVDKYHTPEQRQRSKDTDFYRLMVNTNDTLDAIEEEQVLLSMNLPACSILLEQFVNSIGRVLQWEPFLQAQAKSSGLNDQRQIFVFLFAQHLLGALDFADHPFSYNFMNVPMGEASSTFMSTFFNRLNPGKVQWFNAQADPAPKNVLNFPGMF